MNATLSPWIWLAPAAALVVPPFLLVPLMAGLPRAQLFKDFYEACLWLTPVVGMIVLGLLFQRRRKDPAGLRQGAAIAAVVLAGLDLVAPLFFYVLLALLAGR
jgi:hypothetical protein